MEKELLLKLVELLIKEDGNSLPKDKVQWDEFIWEYIILRWYDSWVHFWRLEKAEKWNYVLTNTRRLWYWKCKKGIWLSSVAKYWLSDESQITCALNKIKITEDRISEIIPCTPEAITNIQEQKEFIPD